MLRRMRAPKVPIWEEPVRGFYTDPGQAAALSGLELLRGFISRHTLPPPIHYLTGMMMTEVLPDSVTFTMPVTDWLLSPQGVVAGSALGFLVDGPLGCTVQTSLHAAMPYTTAEISFSFLRTVHPGVGTLTGKGRLIHAGRTILISEVPVTDEAGRLIAITTTRCVTLPRMDVPAAVVEEARRHPPQPTEPDWPTPHPFERPAEGGVVSQEVWDKRSGLDVLRALMSGELPSPPIHYLCGITPVLAEEGRTAWRMPASEWLCSPVQGRLYGGATAYLAGTALDGAYQSTVPAGTAVAPVDLKVYFLRPVVPDGRDLVATGTIVHRGRSIAVATSEVLDGDGKRVRAGQWLGG